MRRPNKGFTLIELLIVVVIIGILAAVAVPKFSASKRRASLGVLQSDMRNLALAQESYFSVHATYSSSLDALNFNWSRNVTIDIPEATGRGWLANGTHTALSEQSCTLYDGEVAMSTAPATAAGVIACD